MPEKHRFAVLFALDVNSPTPGSSGPSEQRLRHVMETGPNSVCQFWTDNVPFLEIEMTVFPRVTIAPIRMPPVPGDRPRTELIDAAVAASGAVGFDRAAFDHVFVVVHGGAGFQYGSNGKGKDAVVFTNNDFSSRLRSFARILEHAELGH
jgi:hypothetical protein